MAEKLVTISKASDLLGCGIHTLRVWDSEGKLKAVRSPGGHRRYRLSEIEALQGVGIGQKRNEDCVAVYCRVSSYEQKKKGDLERQKCRVLEHCVNQGCRVGYVLDEVSSGMNDNRNKLKRLFSLVQERKVNRVVVEHKDRLVRFMFNVLVEYFSSYDVVIECVEGILPKTYEAELVEDVLSLMSSFSAKIYGKRSAENRKKKGKSASPKSI